VSGLELRDIFAEQQSRGSPEACLEPRLRRLFLGKYDEDPSSNGLRMRRARKRDFELRVRGLLLLLEEGVAYNMRTQA